MNIKNLGAVLTKQKKKLSVCNLEIQNLPKGCALVKMKYSGICHTQLNEINGVLGRDKYLPHCIGHEGVGEIIKLGRGVKNLKKNDNVVISWVKNGSKKKYEQIYYLFNGKKINSGGCNSLSQYAVVSDDRIYKISKKNKYLRESILLGCALPTASNAIFQLGNFNPSSKVLIMGMGGLGYACYFVLNFLKCKDITCIDSNPKRIKFSKKFPNIKSILINPKNIDIFKNKNNEKFDLIIDCTGSKKLIEKTLSLCKKFTGKFVIIGNTKINEKILIKTWDIISGKTLMGAWGSGGTIMKNFKRNENILIDQIKFIKKMLPNKNFKIADVNIVIKNFSKGKILRPIFKF